MASFIRLRIKKFAIPLPFAQLEIDCKILGFVLAISLSLSSNFSQTRGTAINNVGRHHFMLSTSVPYKASGLAK